MASALDELSAPPGSPESVNAPSEFDRQNAQRNAQFEKEFNQFPSDQTEAAPNRLQVKANRFKAEDLASRGIPSYRDVQGDVGAVRDPDTSEALTTGKETIAYNQAGQPRAIKYGETGPPTVTDPFADLPSRVNPDTGAIEKTGPHGLYQYEGQDPDVTAKLAHDAADKEIKNQVGLLKEKATLDEYDNAHANKDLDASRANLVKAVPALGGPQFGEDSTKEDVMKAVNQHFDEQYGAPEANATAGWFGKGLSPEATALRQQIDAKKAQTTADVENHFTLKQQISDRDDQIAATKQAEQAGVGTLLSHQAGTGLFAQPAAPAVPGRLYPPATEWPRILGGDDAAHAVQGGNVLPGGKKSGNEPVPTTATEDLDKPFAADEKSYRVGEDKSFHLDPNNMVKGLHQAVEDGLIDDAKAKEILPQAKQISDAIDERSNIIRDAGGASKVKALAYGAGKGAAFLAGFGPGAAGGAQLGAFGGPLDFITVPAGAIIGGLVGGGLTQYGAKKLVDKLGESNDTIRSFSAASEIHPYYDAAGNLVSMAAGIPRAGAEALVRAAGENPVAQSIANSYLRSSGGLFSTISNLAKDASIRAAGGASTATIAKALSYRVGGAALANVAIDTAINEGSKALGFQKQGETIPGAVQAALIGTFMAGHGLAFKEYSQNEMADILVRAKGAMDAGRDINTVLNPKESEAFNAFSTELRRKVNSGELPINTKAVAGTVRQALQGDSPYGVAAADIEGKGGTPELPEGKTPKGGKPSPAPEKPVGPPVSMKSFVPTEKPISPTEQKPTKGGEANERRNAPKGQVQAGPGVAGGEQELGAPGGEGAEPIGPKGGAAVSGRGRPAGVNVENAPAERVEEQPTKGGEKNEREISAGPAVAGGREGGQSGEAGGRSAAAAAETEGNKGPGRVEAGAEPGPAVAGRGEPTGEAGAVGTEVAPARGEKPTGAVPKKIEQPKGKEENVEREQVEGKPGGRVRGHPAEPGGHREIEEPAKGQVHGTATGEIQRGLAVRGDTVRTGGAHGEADQGTKGELNQPERAGVAEREGAGRGAEKGAPRVRISTPEEARKGVEKARQVHAEEIARLGVPHTERDVGRSGIAAERDASAIAIHPEALASAADVVHKGGGDSQKWIEDAYDEELSHIRGIRGAGKTFNLVHAKIWTALSKEAQAAVKKLYPDTTKITHLAAEYARMVDQQRRLGRITEDNFSDTSAIKPFLEGKQSESLEEHLRQMAGPIKPTKELTKEEEKYAVRKPSPAGILQHPPERAGEQAGGRIQPGEQGSQEPTKARPPEEEKQPEQKPGPGQPARAAGLDDKANEALDKAFEGLFAAEPVKYQPTVKFRGQEFSGKDHDEAITKLEERFPNYRETSRKAEPIVRGWKTPEGKFKTLMQIARPWASSDASQQSAWLEKQASPAGDNGQRSSYGKA